MIPLLFLVLFAEGAVAFLLMVKIGPLRELTMKVLDQLMTGKGPATMKTLACTVGVIFLSSLVSIVKIQNKDSKLGTVTPMDQVLWRTHLLEASFTEEMLESLEANGIIVGHTPQPDGANRNINSMDVAPVVHTVLKSPQS